MMSRDSFDTIETQIRDFASIYKEFRDTYNQD